MSTAALYDVVALGLVDKYLTKMATMTFWRYVHNKHSAFAIESVNQPFNTNTAFGQEAQILLNRVGDLCYYNYLRVILPGIVACDTATDGQCAGINPGNQFRTAGIGKQSLAEKADEKALVALLPDDFADMSQSEQITAIAHAKGMYMRSNYGAGKELTCCANEDDDPSSLCPELGDTWCHWCNDIGHFMVEKASLIIGGQKVDQTFGLFLFIWEELSGKSGRRLTELTGRRYTRGALTCDASASQTLYIPLNFYFSKEAALALPLASLAYHGVQINVDFAGLQKLVVVSNETVSVRNASTGLALVANDLKADMEVTYVYLDQAERERFQSASFEQLIVQLQHYSVTTSNQIARIGLSFNHPTLELIFCVRRACHEMSNNWTNLSGWGGKDPIVHAELLLNTASRFGKKPALYWRAVVPYQHHSNIPEAFVYVMSFALSPEMTLNPSGSLNMSRIDNVELVLEMQEALQKESVTVLIFSRSWNVMRFREGVAGAAFQ